jgi:hypothetical protein
MSLARIRVSFTSLAFSAIFKLLSTRCLKAKFQTWVASLFLRDYYGKRVLLANFAIS